MCENFNLSIDGSIRSLSPFNSRQCFHLDCTVLLFNVYTYFFRLNQVDAIGWHMCVFFAEATIREVNCERKTKKKKCAWTVRKTVARPLSTICGTKLEQKNNSNNNNHMHPHQNWCSLSTVRIHCCCCFFMWAFTQVGNFRRHLTLCKTQYELPTVF